MSEQNRFRYGKAIAALLVLLVAFLMLALSLTLSYNRSLLTEEAAAHSKHELQLIGTLSREALLRHDYITVRSFLTQFAADQPEIFVLRAVTADHFVLADYRRNRQATSPLSIQQEVLFENHPLVTLEMVNDLSFIEETLTNLKSRLILVALLFTTALGLSLWYLLRVMAMLPLEQEITVRRQTEEAARQSEERFRLLSEATFEGVGVVQEGKVIDSNQQMAAMLGYETSELIGLPVEEIVAPQSRSLVMANIAKGYQGLYEYFLQRRDGSLVACESRARMMEWQGKKARVTVVRDISERKQAEALLRESELVLNRKNKMESLGTLAAGIAHDMNNVLHVMAANLELIRREPTTPPQGQALTILSQCEQRGAELIQQILRFSRQTPTEKHAVNLTLLVKETTQLLTTDSLFSGVNLALRLAPEQTPLLADEQEIRQVVSNLLINACQALRGEDGSITVTLVTENHHQAIPIYDGQLKPGRYQRLTVTDNGCGMDHATMATLFEPFFTTRENSGGTGLGLAIIHGIMHAHDGGIMVVSKPGIGTTFHLYFPVPQELPMERTPSPAPAITASPATRETAPTSKGPFLMPSEINILLVDDELLSVENWSALLALEGFSVQGFSSGAEALDAFNKEPQSYAILLTDLRMPGISGRELALALRQLRPDIPIIFSTGWVDKETEILIKGMANSALLSKPYEIETLKKIILELCIPMAATTLRNWD